MNISKTNKNEECLTNLRYLRLINEHFVAFQIKHFRRSFNNKDKRQFIL